MSAPAIENQDAPNLKEHPDDPVAAKLRFTGRRRLPMIRQVEASECGLACLAMVTGYHGHHVGLAPLRQRFSPSLKGTSLFQIIAWAQSLAFTARPLRLEPEQLRQLQLPCLLHWDLNHFVVLREVRRDTLVIHDPATGVRTFSMAQLGKHFSGVALELSMGPAFRRKAPAISVPLRTLAGSVQGLGRALGHVFGLALALEVIALLMPQFMQIVVDQVLAGGDSDLLMLIGVTFSLLLILQTLISALRSWTITWISTHFSLNWTTNVFQHLLKLPQAYFLSRHLGDVVSRFGAINVIQQTLTTQFVGAILDGLMVTLSIGMLLAYSPTLTAIVGAGVAFYIAVRLLYFRVFREANLNQIVVNARQQSSFMESVRGVQTLRLNNQSAAQSARYANLVVDSLNTSVGVQRLTLVFGSISGLISGAQRIAVLWIGTWFALNKHFSAGMLMAFVAYADQFASRSSALVDYLIQTRLLRLQGERLADIVLTHPEPYSEGIYAGSLPQPSVSLKGVGFRYSESDPWILKNCSFDIKNGESVALVGSSGVGKSTLVRVVLGLLDPQEGSITIGGVDLRHLGKARYREMIGSVMQDDVLLTGSVADNVSFFDEAATLESVEAACKLAGLHDDIVAMPMGYHTFVGDMGSSLSGGQQQRLYLARALYRNPKILILDEATSHLDVVRERSINENISNLGITRIIIAHRPETIAHADRILEVTRNGVVERNSAKESSPPLPVHTVAWGLPASALTSS